MARAPIPLTGRAQASDGATPGQDRNGAEPEPSAWASLRPRTNNAFDSNGAGLDNFVATGGSLVEHLTEQLNLDTGRSRRAADRRTPDPYAR